MARTLTLTDGTSSVDLLDTSGFQVLIDGSSLVEPSARTIYNSSMFADGRSPVMRSANNVTASYRVRLEGTSHDNLASQIQTLVRLIRKARNYHMKAWQQTPVYLQTQTTGETNTRYTLIYDGTIEIEDSVFDPPVDPGNRINEITVTLEREPYWRSHAPHTMPDAITLASHMPSGADDDDTEQWVSNQKAAVEISHIFNYDSSAAAFSLNKKNVGHFAYFYVADTTVANNDCVYFGAAAPWNVAVLNIGTAFSGDVDYVVEYYDGAAWQTDTWLGVSGGFFDNAKTGSMCISISNVDDWSSTTINSQDLYWIRIRITAVTTWTQFPYQDGQFIYLANDTSAEFDNAQIDGDVSALALMKIRNMGLSRSTQIMCGLKTRGLTDFRSRLNLQSTADNGNWTVTHYGSSDVTDSRGPDGNLGQCDFTGGADTDGIRLNLDATGANIGESEDWAGDYFVYLRAEQVNGSDGDSYANITLLLGSNAILRIDTPLIYFKHADGGPEIIPMGYFSFGNDVFGSENGVDRIRMALTVGSAGGNYVNLWDLIFIPVDEWSAVFSSYPNINGPYSFYMEDMVSLQADSGIRRNQALLVGEDESNEYILSPWETRGILPTLEPSRQSKLFFLFSNYAETGELRGLGGCGGGIKIYTHERWSLLRGSD
ncbi:MAG: hypothetical protein U9N61_02780 [Euryarchaeota archaeon]|nr:hypothetical protein [Euryarchaeota archaeon]